MVEPQHNPHQSHDSPSHYHDHREWRRETNLPIVPVVGFGRPPWSMGLNDFLNTLVFRKTTLFHALATGQPWPLSLGYP
jgi:hypothetical protein